MEITYDASPRSMHELYKHYSDADPGSAICATFDVLRENVPLWLSHATSETLETVHTLLEYTFDYIRFGINRPDGFLSTSRQFLNFIHSQLKLIEVKLLSIQSLSDATAARAQRIEAAYQDILSAAGEAEQRLMAMERSRRFPVLWIPSFRSRETFSSEAERNFMTRLRHLRHRNVYTTNITRLAEELVHLCCEELRNNHTVLSEASTDTAIRAILSTFRSIAGRARIVVLGMRPSIQRLYGAIVAMNRPDNLRQRELDSNVYAAHVSSREADLRLQFMQIERQAEEPIGFIDDDIPVFIDEPPPTVAPRLEVAPDDPPSALWRKLLGSGPLSAAMEEDEADLCSVCFNNINQINYAILDHCVHRFCVECICGWFENRSTCPNCRSQTTAWTTRDHMASALEQQRQQKEHQQQ